MAGLSYYSNGGAFRRWEHFSESNIHKYRILDRDDPCVNFHSPDKMLIYVIRLPDIGNVRDKAEYLSRYRQKIAEATPGHFISTVEAAQFSNSVILNDYERFATKVFHSIMAL